MSDLPLVTLMTDFGTADAYVAVMKGVILKYCPRAQIVDLTHEIPPQDVRWGAFVLAHSIAHFPPRTLHVAVVDPGVGTARRVLAGSVGNQRVLGPDNGLLWLALREMGGSLAAVEASRLPGVPASRTFHGRDVFAPLAGRILAGLDVEPLGPDAGPIAQVDWPEPAFEGGGVVGCVVYVDRFGNLVSNISRGDLEQAAGGGAVEVFVAGRSVGTACETYAQAEAGAPLALINSMDLLEVAVNLGSALSTLGAGLYTEVRVVPVHGR